MKTGLITRLAVVVLALVSLSFAELRPSHVQAAPTVVTVTYSNGSPTTIPASGTSGKASPYPGQAFTAAGLYVTDIKVTLIGLTHTHPSDLDILLVAPNGSGFVLMSDAGGSSPINNVDLTFTDAASNYLPDTGQLVAGIYKPTNFDSSDTFPAPAPATNLINSPAPAGVSTLNQVSGDLAVQGNWSLYIVDDSNLETGTLADWSITVTGYRPVPTLYISLTPASPVPVGTRVYATGRATGPEPYRSGGVSIFATFNVFTDNLCTNLYAGHQPAATPDLRETSDVQTTPVLFDQPGNYYWQISSGGSFWSPARSPCISLLVTGATGISFTQVPGSAREISVGAGGNVVVVGAGPSSPAGNYGIYRLVGSSFQAMPGAGVKVATDPFGYPWIINAAGSIFHWNGSYFDQVPGNAMDIAVGADNSVWVIGFDGNIYHLVGAAFQQVPGSAVKIAVGSDGNPWVINAFSGIYHLVNGLFQQVPGAAREIDAGPNGQVWVIGTGAVGGGNFGIYQLTNGLFSANPGAASIIAVGGSQGLPWVINAAGGIYQGTYNGGFIRSPAAAASTQPPVAPSKQDASLPPTTVPGGIPAVSPSKAATPAATKQ